MQEADVIVQEEKYGDIFDNLTEGLSLEDIYKMEEYIKFVSEHYKIDRDTTIKELLKSKDVSIEKFHRWKSKKVDA